MSIVPNTSRRALLAGVSASVFTGACASFFSAQDDTGNSALRRETLDVMKRAARFMRERVAYRGGYVWSYAADFSRRWGEMEAYPTMIWMQPPGTATVGHLYLDCFHATRDEFYYQAAMEVAEGLIAAQHPAGGWNYLHDFAGEESARRWYETIGKNGWRLEEFHYYYGNATFDDAGTSEASQFLLRLYLERRSSRLREPVERAVRFVLDSQYENGGWPQRFPRVEGEVEYAPYITFNDAVADENIKFLLMVYHTLGDERALAAIRRAMEIFPATQQRAPQAGWSLQHHHQTLAPMGARSYEPLSLATHTTAGNIAQMLDFYEWTGERRFIERIPEALAWLDALRLRDDQVQVPGRHHPTFIEFETNRARINHRRGSNSGSGEYYWDYDVRRPITHYSQWRALNVDALRQRYESLAGADLDALLARSPLNPQRNFRLPRLFTTDTIDVSDLNSAVGAGSVERPSTERVIELINSLNEEGYWPTPLSATSNPYIGEPSATPSPGDFAQTLVGDAFDTSPYVTQTPVTGISTAAFIQNMSSLLLSVDSGE
ncbi:MAG: pectate lyase [Alphaproteobacteria bacterium]|nr:MAG: pectate lyase [Alphaproteobacteria bacterium]